jgi:hypothetical protein
MSVSSEKDGRLAPTALLRRPWPDLKNQDLTFASCHQFNQAIACYPAWKGVYGDAKEHCRIKHLIKRPEPSVDLGGFNVPANIQTVESESETCHP